MGRIDRRLILFTALILLLTAAELTVSITLKKTGLLLPAVLVLSFVMGRLGRRSALRFLCFSLATVGALPSLVRPELPFNYVPVLLMVVTGLALARPRSLSFMIKEPLFRAYLFWFSLMGMGALFLLMRWSTLTEGALRLFPDLLTSPAGDRISFTLLFPTLTLSLYGLAPLVLGLKRELGLTPKKAFIPFIIGYFISALFAALQHLSGLSILTREAWMKAHFSNGLASDFNGMGLISGIVFFYALILLADPKRRPLGGLILGLAVAALPVSVICAWWSNSRTALLIFIVALFWFASAHRRRLLAKPLRPVWIGFGLLLVVGLGLPGVRSKVIEVVQPRSGQSWVNRIDELSNMRLTMLRDGLETVARYPLSGIGPGNYLFFQRHKHFQQNFLHDMPLNQFLLILLEGGILSLVWYLFWLSAWYRRSEGPWRMVLVALLLSFLVGTPLWLPEGMVLFWLVLAFGLSPGKRVNGQGRLIKITAGMFVLAVFMVVNIQNFRSLDPGTWQLEHHEQNGYGLWAPDPGMEGVFCWTKGESGLFITKQEQQALKIFCGAPLDHLPEKKQTVRLFWQGEPLKTVVFTENRDQEITLPAGEAGWLEFTVDPVFVLKELNLGPETRGLGVQLHFQPSNQPSG